VLRRLDPGEDAGHDQTASRRGEGIRR
jgi:hypothetical protein